VSEPGDGQPILAVAFYVSATGHEPVREWLLGLEREDRGVIGRDVKTARYGWPLGMPPIRELEPGLWEVRSHLAGGVARVLFTVEGQTMVLLHGFVKKSQKTPAVELKTARRRLADLWRGVSVMADNHIGSDLDDFLRDDGLLDDAESVAAKRVIAFQIAREMERAHISRSELARRMKTSRSAVERLLDPANPSVTLSTLERAASAVGKRLTVQLSA